MLSVGSLDYVWKTFCTGVAVCSSVLCCASRLKQKLSKAFECTNFHILNKPVEEYI